MEPWSIFWCSLSNESQCKLDMLLLFSKLAVTTCMWASATFFIQVCMFSFVWSMHACIFCFIPQNIQCTCMSCHQAFLTARINHMASDGSGTSESAWGGGGEGEGEGVQTTRLSGTNNPGFIQTVKICTTRKPFFVTLYQKTISSSVWCIFLMNQLYTYVLSLIRMIIVCCACSDLTAICSPFLLCRKISLLIVIILLCRILHLALAIMMVIEYFLKTWPTFVFDIPVVSGLL